MTELEVRLALSVRYCALHEEAQRFEAEIRETPAGDYRDMLIQDAMWTRAAMLAIEQEAS